MAEDDFRGVIFHASQGDESLALEFASPRCSEGLGIRINRWGAILTKYSSRSPISGKRSGAGVNIVSRAVGGLAFAEDDAHQVMRAGSVISLMHGGSGFVIRLCQEIRRGHSLQVVAKSAKG